ncbi:hypothetical protein GO495_14690 [Chitinophaga oryziterrae]|uniref:Uncharacterized protein n=1 Tax=Chitinophaga oryziterrae TaxID=1031224 RepID=A0A6N8J978_9BACT|nr:hypothetical protein [Chitinophaga oryziterrae]MVT41835.1 hypothetical protein [Chitinophaga oryziterrae]
MAKTKDNIFTEGLSGTVAGKMTLRQRAGATIVSRKSRGTTIPATDDQLVIQDRFKEATMYAKMAIKDPVTKALYAAVAKPEQSAYNVAFRDAFLEPEIKSIDTALYKGNAGEIIVIRADQFKIVKMLVVITTAGGLFVEQGYAVLRSAGGSHELGWAYTTLSNNLPVAGTKITVTVYDRPGHEAVKEVVIA